MSLLQFTSFRFNHNNIVLSKTQSQTFILKKNSYWDLGCNKLLLILSCIYSVLGHASCEEIKLNYFPRKWPFLGYIISQRWDRLGGQFYLLEFEQLLSWKILMVFCVKRIVRWTLKEKIVDWRQLCEKQGDQQL